jgi:stage II sporulation protein D
MKWLILFSLFFISLETFAQKISVSLFNELDLQTILITPVEGSYSLITGDGEFILNPNQIVYISRTGDSITVRDMASNLGTWNRVTVVGRTNNDVIRVKPIVPSIPAQVYDDNLGFYVDFNRMMAINLVDIDKYIAGVVEAESGPNAHIEFYKAQVLLARTYAYGHMERHVGEGFNLCDGVHCQAYKGKSTKNPSIIKATEETKGQVVVDSNNELIVGSFHANCGGQTANSGDVWVTSYDYLVSVDDLYCKGQPSSQWEIRIPIEEWRAFLISKGIDAEDLPPSSFVFAPKGREYNYPIANTSIPLTDIRNHFKLRSAYFSVDIVSNSVRLRGKGYGHGVGMCQDGAMQMARRGKSYKEILLHYFTGVSVIDFSEINGMLNEHDIDLDE